MFYPEDADPYDPNNHSMDEAWSWDAFKWYFHQWMPGVTDAEYVNNLYDGETRYMDDHLRTVFDALRAHRGRNPGDPDRRPWRDPQRAVGLLRPSRPVRRRHPCAADLLLARQDASGQARPRLRAERRPRAHDPGAGGRARPRQHGRQKLACRRCLALRDGNYDELFLSEATWELKRGYRDGRWKFIDSIEQDPHGRPMQELFDLNADPEEQRNVIDLYPDVARDVQAQDRRLGCHASGRKPDATRTHWWYNAPAPRKIGEEIPGEVLGAGATPLHERTGEAANIPAPDDLGGKTVVNETRDENQSTILHGYVEDEESSMSEPIQA